MSIEERLPDRPTEQRTCRVIPLALHRVIEAVSASSNWEMYAEDLLFLRL